MWSVWQGVYRTKKKQKKVPATYFASFVTRLYSPVCLALHWFRRILPSLCESLACHMLSRSLPCCLTYRKLDQTCFFSWLGLGRRIFAKDTMPFKFQLLPWVCYTARRQSCEEWNVIKKNKPPSKVLARLSRHGVCEYGKWCMGRCKRIA